jgi:hypothetical protein
VSFVLFCGWYTSSQITIIASSILVVDFKVDEEFQVGGEEDKPRISGIIELAMTSGA